MVRIKLAAFALGHAAQFGLWKAGADMCGGRLRRHRANAHRNLSVQAVQWLVGRGPG